MKRSWLLAATAPAVFSNPLPEDVAARAADPPSGIGTGVTIAIAPAGGIAQGCYGNWNGAAFGIAAVPINVQRNADGADSTQSADPSIPKFTLAPSVSGSMNEMADFDMPAVTGKPALRVINGDARAAAAADPDSDVTVTSYSTRTRTKTVTLKSAGPGSPAAVASPTAVDLSGMKTIKAAQIYQINDGQVQAAPSPSPIPLKPVPTPTGSGAYPTSGSGSSPAPFAPLPQGAPRISQIGDGQIQAPTDAAGLAAASGLAATTPKSSKGSKGGMGSMAENPPAPEPLVAPVDALLASADEALVASGEVPADAFFASTDALGLTEDEMSGGAEDQSLVKRQSKTGRTGGYGCKNKDGSTLEMTLKNGVLTDNKGRTGYIADNRQFQFDAPPQAGAQVTAGWGICEDGFLSLGPNKVFYQCLSGSFYNLYDRNIAAQCRPINLIALENRNC